MSHWSRQRVFVTGHTGFKGSWLSLWLLELGAEVCGYALAPDTQPSLFEAAGLAGRMRSITADVRDPAALGAALADFRPDVVLHLAAQSLVRRSYDQPTETYATNVMGTVNLLEALRRHDRPCVVVNVTSDKCYQNREWVWGYRENDPLGGYDPYSSSKGCAELVTAAYRQSYFSATSDAAPRVALASARAGNVIGGGDWAEDRLLPDCARAIGAGRPVVVRRPRATRPWQHVLEPLAGYLLLAERLAGDAGPFARAWNFGPADDDVREVGWIVEQAARAWGPGAQWELAASDLQHEANALKLDSSLARSLLGWRPRLNIETALAWTVEWYRRFAAGEDAAALTLEQVRQYQSLQ